MALDYAYNDERGGVSDWNLLLAYFHSSQAGEFNTTDSTYEELESGGELGLIEDLDLRRQLANYYTNAGDVVMTERPAYREHVRGLIPIRIQNYIWDACYDSSRGRQVLLDCD